MAEQINVYERARQLQEQQAALAAQQAAEAAAAAERTRGRTLGETAGDIGLAALGGAVGLGGAAYGLANVATGGFLDRGLGFSQNLQETQQALDSWKSAPLQARKQEAADAFANEGLVAGAGEYLSNPSLLVDTAVQSLPYMIPGVAAARAAGGVAAAGTAARGLSQAAQASAAESAALRASLVTQGALTGGYLNVDAVNAAQKAGLSEGEQQLMGLGAAAVGAIAGPAISKLTGAAGLEARAAQAFGGSSVPAVTGSAAARVAAGAGKEFAEEALQEGTEQAITNVAGQRPIGEGVGESAVVGGILGLGLGGAMGLAEIRRPSIAREEATALRAEVEAELAGGTGESPLRPSLIQQAQIQDALNRADLARQFPQVEELSAEQALTSGPAISLATNPSEGLTGLNAVIAEQRALQAAQPPRMNVQEMSMEQYAPAPTAELPALPEVAETNLRSVQDIVRETAPIARVAQQFGPAVAGQEAARRATAIPAPTEPTPVDISTPTSLGEFRKSVRSALASTTGKRAADIRGDYVDAITRTAAERGALPGTPEFNSVVSTEVSRQLAAVEGSGRSSAVLGALSNAYPVAPEVQEQITAEQDFDRAVAADVAAAELDPRLGSPQDRTALRELVSTVNWDQKGGQLLRDATGTAVGRTQWLSSQPELQRVLTDAGVKPGDVSKYLDKLDAGQPLTEKQANVVTSLLDTAAELNTQAAAEPVVTQPADAANPKEVSAAPAQYNPADWAAYQAYPGSRAIDGLTAVKQVEGNPQPVLSAMLMGIDIAGDLSELNIIANAARAHPEFAAMGQDARTQVATHIAIAVNRVTGATFEMGSIKPRRQLQVDTPQFKKWFGKSKIVDAAGKPQVVYHGSSADINEFETDRASGYKGAYFTRSRPLAEIYAGYESGEQGNTRGDGGAVYPVYLSMQNPLVVGSVMRGRGTTAYNLVRKLFPKTFDSLEYAEDFSNRGRSSGFITDADVKAMKDLGYDGIVNDRDGEIVVFDPTQVKSATGNTGSFDPANPDIRFREGAVATGAVVSDRLFVRGVDEAQKNLGTPVFGFNTVAALEAQVGYPLPENTKGMYAAGQIYVVRENIANGKDLAFTIAHEVGHSSMAKLLGPSLKAATNRMWANSEMRTRIKAKMAELNMAQGTEVERTASRTLAAEEVLADMLASGEKLNKDIWSKLRAGVREFLARAFGVRNYIVTNAEVDGLLSDVAKVSNGAAAAQVNNEMANRNLWLANADEAAEANPKFSKVQADLDEVIAQAERESPAKVIPLHDVAKAAGEASVDAAKSIVSALKHNTPGDLYIQNAMHLNQLADWYDKMFDGKIGAMAALKRGKEAFFNQQNSRPIDMEYKGQHVAKQSVNDTAKELSQFGRQNPQKFKAWNNMMQFSTFYKVFPDAAWDKQNDVDYVAAGYSMDERKEAHRQMVELYRSIGPQGQALYRKTQAIYKSRWDTRFETLSAELDRIGKMYTEENTNADGTVELIQKYKADIRLAMQRISEGPYSPLQRNGEHLVVARNGTGDVIHFSAYETRDEAEIARKQIAEKLRAEGETTGAVAVTRQKDFDVRVNGVSRGTIEGITRDIRSDMEAALPPGLDQASRTQIVTTLTNGLTEAYLQALPQNAFMKHARNRKNVEGFDVDAFRAFADYTLRSARDISNIKFDGQIGGALNAVQKHVDDTAAGRLRAPGQEGVLELDTSKMQTVADAVKRQHAASLEVVENKAVNALSQGGFVYFMTSPSQMFLNATQTYMVAFPRLAGQYGAGAAIRQLNKAAGQYFKSGFDLLGEKSVVKAAANTDRSEAQVDKVLTALYEDGTLDFTQAHDLAELSGGRNSSLTPYLSKAMEVMSYAMHKSEVFNRQVTASAAVRLELEKMRREGGTIPAEGTPEHDTLQTQLADVARRAIDTTHFDYSQSNKPALMQGAIGKLAFQFQQYRFHMLAMIGKDLRDAELGKLVTLKKPNSPEEAAVARETLAWLLGAQLAFTGTAGTILAPFVFAIADAFKDDDDLTSSRTDWINAVGKYAAHGVLAGVIDTQRIAADTLIPYLGDKAYEPIGGKPSDVLAYHVNQNLGPWVGLLGDAFDGTAAFMNGDMYKASQTLLPKPFRDATKSLYEGANGAKDARGIVYNEPSVLSGVTQFIGLRSAERRDVEAARSAVYRANKLAYGAEDRYLTRLALAYSNGDAEAIAEANTDIQNWNAKYPDLSIKASDIKRAIITRIRTENVAAQTGVVSSRMPGPTIDAVLGR